MDTFHKTEDNVSCVCDEYISVGSNKCLSACNDHQEAQDKQCECVNGFAPSKNGIDCTCEDILSMDKKQCLQECPLGQEPITG